MWFITRLILTNSNWKPPWSDLDFVFFAGERANLRLWGVSLRVSGLADLPQLVLHPRHVLFEIFPWILFCVPQGFLQWCMWWRRWPIPSQAPGSATTMPAGRLHCTASRLFIRLSVCTMYTRFLSRFFDRSAHETMHAYIENKHFFTKSCHPQTYQNSKISWHKICSILLNKVI